MMAGLALGETTLGPLIMVVAFAVFLGGHSQALFGPPGLGRITAAVIGAIVHLAGVFARQTWMSGGWHMLPDLAAMALTKLASWLLIRRQLSVFKLLGLCTALGLVWQLLF
jgi:chromate transporter